MGLLGGKISVKCEVEIHTVEYIGGPDLACRIASYIGVKLHEDRSVKEPKHISDQTFLTLKPNLPVVN